MRIIAHGLLRAVPGSAFIVLFGSAFFGGFAEVAAVRREVVKLVNGHFEVVFAGSLLGLNSTFLTDLDFNVHG